MRNSGCQHMPAKPVPSLWQRVRSAASTAIAAVRSAGARVIAFVARKATGARAALSRVVRAAMTRRPRIPTRQGAGHMVTHITGWCRDTWTRVVHPFMRVRVMALGIGAVVIGLVAAPIGTLAVVAATGAALLGLSHLIAALEHSRRPAARIALTTIEYAAQALRVVAYVATGAVVLTIGVVSVSFALTEIGELVLRYFDVPHAALLAALAFFVMTANWGLGIVEIAWLALVHDNAVKFEVGERQEIPGIRTDADRAWNGDELVYIDGTWYVVPLASEVETTKMIDGAPHKNNGKCEGCDLDDCGPRFGIGKFSLLCGECFSFLVEDELITAAGDGQVSAEDVIFAINAGIQVPAAVVIASGAKLRSTRIDLDIEDVTCRTSAHTDSKKDPTQVYWAETAWWFDAHGSRRARRWHGFVAGLVTSIVEYNHQKGSRGFYASVEGSGWVSQAFKTLAGAQDTAADEIADLAVVPPSFRRSHKRNRVAGAVS